VKGCPSLPSSDYVKGNVREHGLQDIWSGLIADKVEKPVELWGFCATCPFAQRCRAGCTWTSHVLFGRPGNNPLCHFRALALAERGLVEKLELVSAAPGEPFDFGRYRIVEEPMAHILEDDPVIGMTLGSQLFKLRAGATGLWSDTDLAAVLS
jgi:radical SAM protein with 4Fe4S-binding SPASM domain